ncbi:MAG: hypothetical protein KJ900_04275 [Proteobacteria bacterium]|nr:hypothetical protein [Desulfocapsa sp.]MBU3944503.1 hypothetical protein [Pseudomonadota bacterium]MCG2743009.1 hypothetical protein [Desulfobacteraceae bacterium]MBU4028752.1 hypothetical protein [Pseudomonadota bacterium]MBU4042100.1 hypothetical protein [Pseudomonadota bacterium]
MSTLTVKINEINELIRSFGRNAVQEIKMKDKDGKVIGQIRYGYKPQYVFDAVNQIIEPENWRYELIKEDIFETQVVTEVKLFLKTDTDEWLCKGSHKGQMNIVKGNVGDAQKGAITDALQKCFSLCSIGQDSYRGILETVFNSHRPKAPLRQSLPKSTQQSLPASSPQPELTQPESQPIAQSQPVPPPEPANPASLPKIAGIEYQQFDNFVVAVGNKLFDKKELLKSAGFKWNKDQKNWYKELTH